MIATALQKDGKWADCDPLKSLWDSPSLARENVATRMEPVFLEVAAIVGACTMPMLAHGIKTMAFEPAAPNLFYQTSSVLANSGYQGRLTPFPYAASDVPSTNKLYVAKGNAGNAW